MVDGVNYWGHSETPLAATARRTGVAVEDDIGAGRFIAVPEACNRQDREIAHTVFVGGATMSARARVFIDFLVERFAIAGSQIDG